MISGLNGELARNLRDGSTDRIVKPYGTFLACTDRYGTARIAFIEGLVQVFFIGSLEVPQIRYLPARIKGYGSIAGMTFSRCIGGHGFLCQWF